MGTSGRYDGSLQMFVEESHEPDLARLAFLRWLGEGRKLEHEVYGPSSGEFVGRPGYTRRSRGCKRGDGAAPPASVNGPTWVG
jgi:hypothetical protein